jgi:hypothetical protein
MVPALRRLRQEDQTSPEFKTILGNRLVFKIIKLRHVNN